MEAGDQVGGYRLVEPLGSGGMGAVWLAEHVQLGRRAAIKVLRPEYAVRADIVTRFFNEARAATSVSDPGIVQVFDFGHHNAAPYIVMELLEGEPLDQRLRRGALSVEHALRIVRQVAVTLGAAHAAGIVHRDIKPENIFMVRDPAVHGGERPKVLDFGIAKLNDISNIKTQTAVVMGTPLYMSPEQCRGAGAVDARSDVYALGCVLFALVTGRPPFEGEGGGEIIAKHQYEAAPRAARYANVPPAIDELIARCLAKPPEQRYGNGGELAAAITEMLTRPSFSQWLATLPADLRVAAAQMAESASTAPSGRRADGRPPDNATISSPPALPMLTAMPHATTLSHSAMGISTRERRTRTPIVVGLASAVIVAIGVMVWIASRDDSVPEPVAAIPKPPPPEPKLPPPPPPDPAATTSLRIGDALSAFATWADAHDGQACPSASDLGDPTDGWERAMRITCTDQPADQRIGIVSAGPDGAAGTVDDISSWSVRELAVRVHGPRWVAAAVATPKKPAGRPKAKPVTKSPQNPPPIELDADGVPKRR